MRVEVNHIFPTPVIKYNLDKTFTKQEIDFILNLKLERNLNNSVTVEKNVLELKELNYLKHFFNDCIQDYINTIIIPKNKISCYITESWINITKNGESHHSHTHPNSFISGVFYISADKQKDKINFIRNVSPYILNVQTENFNIFNSKTWWLPASTGTLYLFPSTLAHEVETVSSDLLRVSLSFNTFLKGVIDLQDTSSLILE